MSPAMMKAIRPTAPNAEDAAAAVKVETIPVPEPGAGEYQASEAIFKIGCEDKIVMVQMKLRPVNPADLFSLMGIYPGCAPADRWPITPGLDGMGVISKAGDSAKKLKIGQRVALAGFPLQDGNGTWAEFAVFKESDLAAIPDGISDEAAAGFWVNPVTAYGMLTELALPKGAHIIVNAAGSALARLFFDMAKHLGLKTIGLVRRDAQVQEVLAAGADACVSTEKSGNDIAAALRAHTPREEGAYAALECVGGESTAHLIDALRPGGTVVIYGAMASMTAHVPIVPVLFRGVSVRGFWLHTYVAGLSSAAERERVVSEVLSLMERGVLRADKHVGKSFRLEQTAEAVRESATPARGGKVFIDSR
ncbi:hypothetical protein JKP88DRAFT_321431 [Tribonema minus]|uniref:Enoyl reductase (ER) domain-containing protein n=1 Tax=Tribonema minus TaxID=303371 RepID=A0A835YUE8_9STRA|nr:hypothetical protein JKP88DRAFT_321431 [Tribonema minus]